MHVPKEIKQFAGKFLENGFQCFLVGGSLRNMVAGREATDFDFATDAVPEDVMHLFPKVIPTGIRHGTVTVLFKSHSFEVTTFRVEGNYSDSRRPDTVTYTPSISEDLKRRDFTINAMALNLANGKLLDPHDGRRDIADKIIRAIGNPVERFDEDGLRIIRACRFASQIGFTIHKDTLSAMSSCRHKLRAVSAERIRDEIEKILMSERPSQAFIIMDSTAILPLLFPELDACKGVEQQGYHDYDVFQHSLKTCDSAPEDLAVRLAALFHDIGKPVTLKRDETGSLSFHRHEQVSEKMTLAIMRRLKFPKALMKRTSHLVRHHMFNYQDTWTDAAVRRFLKRVGAEHFEDLLKLRLADQMGMGDSRVVSPGVDNFRSRVRGILEADSALSISDLEINGRILHQKGDIPNGPEMGRVLDFLLESVIDDPGLNTEEDLLRIGVNFYREYLEKRI